MRNLKKFLALALSMMMVLSLFVTASAQSIDKDGKGQDFKDTTNVEFQTAIDVLNGMEVLKGDADPATGALTGNFRPTDTITRAEVAALVFRLSTGLTDSKAADHYAQYGNFSDVDKSAWYAGYVGYCANAGYIKGYSGVDGPFGPKDPVTGYQALAMILRAMGWGAKGEFEATDWRLNVSSIGTQNGILAGINSTHFGGSNLDTPAQRQVVAEIFFQAAMTDCVVWTPAYGYQSTNVATGITGGTSTDSGATVGSLGYRYFGLTRTERIVLGNKATGEDNTILGSKLNNANKNDLGVVDNVPYAYNGDAIAWNEDGDAITFASNNLTLKVDTGIDLFGHKVEAYYDARGGGAHRTYAIYDEAKSAVVYAKDGSVTGDLGTQAANAKFALNKFNGFHTSDRYDRIDWENATVRDADARPASGNDGFRVTAADKFTAIDNSTYWGTDNAVKEDNENDGDDGIAAGAKPYGSEAAGGQTDGDGNNEVGSYYMLISNSANNNLDVVITLAPELARITEHNTTVTPNTLRLSGKSDVAMGGYPGTKPSTFGENDNGYIRMGSLTDGSKTDLGSLVVAWEIKGTNYSMDHTGKLIKDNSNEYFYQLDEVKDTYKGTVKTYNPNNGEVTLTDGKVLKFTLLPIINEATDAPKDGVDGHNGDLYFYNGVEYTFMLDPTDNTRYVSYAQGSDYEFLYGVYGDYSIGNLGSADLDYAITGVDWDGNIKYTQPFTTINNAAARGANYEVLTIAKKNLGSANGNWDIGNEIMSGMYTGYGYNAGTKDLDAAVAGLPGENWTGMDAKSDNNGYANKYWAGKLVSDFDGDDTDTNGIWEINQGNVADGWSQQTAVNTGVSTIDSENGRLLLTPNTKFIIVDGLGIAGSSNPVTVDIRNGIGALLGDSTKVTIDVNRYAADGTQIADHNVYFKVTSDRYNNWYNDNTGIEYSDDNYMVDTVILPKAAISWSSTNNLWFTNKVNATGRYLADTHADTGTIAQYKIWQNGEGKEIFVDWAQSTNVEGQLMTSVNDFVEDAAIGMFFELTQVNTINGEPIYKATAMSISANVLENVYQTNNPNTICNVNLKYDYTAVNNTSTARLTQRGDHGTNYTQSATTRSDVYNVSNAIVVNLSGTGNITDVKTLNNAVSVGYDVTVAIVNNGHAVSVIYVTDVQ